MNALKIGDKAPDFVIDQTSQITLHGLINQNKAAAVVYFYPMDFSPVCSAQACMVREMHQSTESGSTYLIIGVSPQSDRVHTKFRDLKNLPQLLVSDKDKSIAKSYGATGLFGTVSRVSYVISVNFEIVDRALGALSLAQHRKLVTDFIASQKQTTSSQS